MTSCSVRVSVASARAERSAAETFLPFGRRATIMRMAAIVCYTVTSMSAAAAWSSGVSSGRC